MSYLDLKLSPVTITTGGTRHLSVAKYRAAVTATVKYIGGVDDPMLA
jgi:hypothetical protein